MLSENIRILRKQKGMSQEMLAQKLNVVRQTVSKWEKGLSVPDAEMLNTLAELLDTSVSTLLGSTVEEKENPNPGIDELAKQLAMINEQLAMQSFRRKNILKKIIFGLLIAFILVIVTWSVLFYLFRVQPRQNADLRTTDIECTLEGKTYTYSITYDQNRQIFASGGNGFISDHVLADRFSDANELLAQIEDYFIDHGGTFAVVDDRAVPAEEK